MSVRYRTPAERARAQEASARKRRTAKHEERETRAEHMVERVADMWKDTGQQGNKISHNSRTGRYVVQVGNKAVTYCEKALTAYIESEYARHHEAEMTADIPEDDK